jgi:hypothetical protein
VSDIISNIKIFYKEYSCETSFSIIFSTWLSSKTLLSGLGISDRYSVVCKTSYILGVAQYFKQHLAPALSALGRFNL